MLNETAGIRDVRLGRRQLGSTPYRDIDTRGALESGSGYHHRLISRSHGGHLHIELVQPRSDQPGPLHLRRRTADGDVHFSS